MVGREVMTLMQIKRYIVKEIIRKFKENNGRGLEHIVTEVVNEGFNKLVGE